jgi:hypothetical protein
MAEVVNIHLGDVMKIRSGLTKRAPDRGDSGQNLLQSFRSYFAGNGIFKSHPRQVTQKVRHSKEEIFCDTEVLGRIDFEFSY